MNLASQLYSIYHPSPTTCVSSSSSSSSTISIPPPPSSTTSSSSALSSQTTPPPPPPSSSFVVPPQPPIQQQIQSSTIIPETHQVYYCPAPSVTPHYIRTNKRKRCEFISNDSYNDDEIHVQQQQQQHPITRRTQPPIQQQQQPILSSTLNQTLSHTQTTPSRNPNPNVQIASQAARQTPRIRIHHGEYHSIHQAQNININAPFTAPSLYSSAQSHINLFSVLASLRDLYRSTVFSLVPIHPSALQNDSVSYICCTDEGRLEHSSLSLAVKTGLLYGAFLSSGYEPAIPCSSSSSSLSYPAAQEMFQACMEDLSYINIHANTDYSLALVITNLAHFASEVADQKQLSFILLTWAIEILQRIKAFPF